MYATPLREDSKSTIKVSTNSISQDFLWSHSLFRTKWFDDFTLVNGHSAKYYFSKLRKKQIEVEKQIEILCRHTKYDEKNCLASSLRKLCFREKKFEILLSEYSEWYITSRNIIFSWRPHVCVCVYVCMRSSTF